MVEENDWSLYAYAHAGARTMKEEESHLISVNIFDIYPYPDAQQGIGAPQNFLVLLKGEEEKRVVPITIGHFEGQALAMAIRKIALPRPLPHDLLYNLLKKMDATVHKLVIHTLKEDVFHAYLMIQAQDEPFYLDCRPSDGMILATLLETPIFMSPEVIDAAGRMLEISDQRETEGEKSIDGVIESLEAPDADLSAVHGALAEESESIAGLSDIELTREGLPIGSKDFTDPATGEPLSELEQLKAHLDWLIAQEAYEQAAKIRDQIIKLEEDG
jgi:bifunctional DNase/RNase